MKVAVIGCGSVGSWVSFLLPRYLPSLDTLALVDFDIIEDKNLQYSIYTAHHVGSKKVTVLAGILRYFYPHVKIEPYPCRYEDIQDKLKKYDLIIDCTDSLPPKSCFRCGYNEDMISITTIQDKWYIPGQYEYNEYRFPLSPVFLATLIVYMVLKQDYNPQNRRLNLKKLYEAILYKGRNNE